MTASEDEPTWCWPPLPRQRVEHLLLLRQLCGRTDRHCEQSNVRPGRWPQSPVIFLFLRLLFWVEDVIIYSKQSCSLCRLMAKWKISEFKTQIDCNTWLWPTIWLLRTTLARTPPDISSWNDAKSSLVICRMPSMAEVWRQNVRTTPWTRSTRRPSVRYCSRSMTCEPKMLRTPPPLWWSHTHEKQESLSKPTKLSDCSRTSINVGPSEPTNPSARASFSRTMAGTNLRL